MEQKQYSKKWQKRFEFFDKHGSPGTPEFKAGILAESGKGRLLIGMNFFAFFFNIIYFLILGLWKKGLVLFGIWIGLLVILLIIDIMIGGSMPRAVYIGLNAGMGALYSALTNYAYYLKEIKGVDGWNPFEGQRML